MKPTIYVALSAEGYINDSRHRHPTSLPEFGGEWTTYVPANTNLEWALAEIKRLNARVGAAYKIMRELSDENTYRLIECGVVSIEIQIEDWLEGGK
jgi:hypothetical protein